MEGLPPPRKKVQVREVPGAALPLPSALPSPPCSSYEATYRHGTITVYDPQQAAALWHNGYFGHGFIGTSPGSRSRPKKRWKLVEADGLRSSQWFKQKRQEAKRGGGGGEEQEGDGLLQSPNSLRSPGEEELGKGEGNGGVVAEEAQQREETELEPWRTVLVLSGDQEKKYPNDPNACLSLLPEEALFLSYALGCLVVTHEEPAPRKQSGKRTLAYEDTCESHEMTIDEMWRVFSRDDPAFAIKYAAFHHYRTQGWVVKSGLKYGVDWVLYPVGPPFYHSQYTVQVQSVWGDTLTLDQTLPGHQVTWTNISTTERLTNHVNKTPIMCLVLRPRSVTKERLGLIECVKELRVQEMLLTRWNPSECPGSG